MTGPQLRLVIPWTLRLRLTTAPSPPSEPKPTNHVTLPPTITAHRRRVTDYSRPMRIITAPTYQVHPGAIRHAPDDPCRVARQHRTDEPGLLQPNPTVRHTPHRAHSDKSARVFRTPGPTSLAQSPPAAPTGLLGTTQSAADDKPQKRKQPPPGSGGGCFVFSWPRALPRGCCCRWSAAPCAVR